MMQYLKLSKLFQKIYDILTILTNMEALVAGSYAIFDPFSLEEMFPNHFKYDGGTLSGCFSAIFLIYYDKSSLVRLETCNT